MSDHTSALWTIADLSDRVGMGVRNIRAHQSRGLIPPPTRRGRIAFYGPAHETALLRILDLQRQGYNLAAIERVLRDDPPIEVDSHRGVLAPLLDVDEVVATPEEFASLFGLAPDPRRLAVAVEHGFLRDLGDGRYAFPSRDLLDATAELVRRGMSYGDLYQLQLELGAATREVAVRFVEAYLRAASVDAERTEGEAPAEAADRFRDLRDLFTLVLAATFSLNVHRATERLLAGRSEG